MPYTLHQDKEMMDVCDVDTNICTPAPDDLELLQLTTPGVPPLRFRKNPAHLRQSRPDSGLGFHV